MITFTHSAGTMAANLPELLKLAHEIAKYVKGKTGVEVKVQIPVAGNPWRVRWTSESESLAAHEQSMSKLMSDPKYMELAARVTPLVIPGSALVELWQNS